MPQYGVRRCKHNSSTHKWLSITYVFKATNQTVRVQTDHKGIIEAHDEVNRQTLDNADDVTQISAELMLNE